MPGILFLGLEVVSSSDLHIWNVCWRFVGNNENDFENPQ